MQNQKEKEEILHTHTKRGFTLIELLIVITIIGTLATIGFLVLSNRRSALDQIEQTKNLSQARNIHTALTLLTAQNFDWQPAQKKYFNKLSLYSDCATWESNLKKLLHFIQGQGINTGLQDIAASWSTKYHKSQNNRFTCYIGRRKNYTAIIIGVRNINPENPILKNDIDGDAGGLIADKLIENTVQRNNLFVNHTQERRDRTVIEYETADHMCTGPDKNEDTVYCTIVPLTK